MQQLLDNPDPEIKTIGLIMETYGAPTGEAACLLRQDVKLTTETPHLIIRNNKYRILGKRRLERAVPIVEPLLSHLKDYIANHFTGSNTDLLFPQFGEGRHASGDRSKKLSDFVDNQRPDDDDLLSPYSLRHTFKDKYQRARVPQDIGEYIFGHRSDQSNKVHAKYGTGRGVEDLVDYMKDIVAVKEWGYFEEYDD
jgi:integrase